MVLGREEDHIGAQLSELWECAIGDPSNALEEGTSPYLQSSWITKVPLLPMTRKDRVLS